jgi:CheY-like chemotaxis protein
VSHELRTPLNLIIGFSEVISRSPESYRGVTLPSAYRRDVNAIYNSAKHLLALIDDVLDLGRIDAGKTVLMRNEVPPAAMVDEVVDMVRDYIRAKGLELRVEVEKKLPILWIDSLRIRQALLNVLANAVRYTSEGFIQLEVFRRDANIVFRVVDSGAGISESDLPHVFDLFHSADSPADAKWHSGTGLGLPLSKKYVEMHGGTMGVESALGKGATFWFSLPSIARTAREANAYSLAMPQSPNLPLAPAQHTVVVVNADAAVISLLQHHLDAFRFVSAATIAEGLALADDTQAIALIADSAAADTVRRSRVPIINFPWPTSRQAAATLGALGFLTKPVSDSQLRAAIDALGFPVRRILIADSDPELVRLFQRILRAHLPIQNVPEAYNLEEVIERAGMERPDLILLELSMLRSADGSSVRTLADIPALREIPVVLISEMNWEDLCLKLSGPIQALRPEGFELGEIVKAAKALFTALSPEWNMEPMPSTTPSG